MSVQLYDQENCTIFWDFETTQIPNAIAIPNYEVVKNLRDAVRPFGPIKSFRAYWNFSGQSTSSRLQLSSLSSSGVSLIDCPGNGRKDLSVKIMLVDLIAHAWDTSPPHTFVVITADRDVAYAISTLRMRGYRVVVISPSSTAEDLSAQASVNLELTRALLGLKQNVGVDEFLDNSVAPGEPTAAFTQQQPTARPASSASQYQKPRSTFAGMNQYEKPSAGFELRNLPTARARRDSIFSYDRHKFDIFGGMEDIPATSNVGQGTFGLGDGPLLPRSQSRAEVQSRTRADSAPPNVFSTGALPAYGGFEENGNGSSNGPASKGKQREYLLSEPEDIAPYPGPFIPYSGSVFEPFGEKRPPFQTAFSFSPPANKPQVTHSSPNSSASSTSRDSPFSLVAAPEPEAETLTPPTSVTEVANETTPRKSPPPPSGKQTEAAPKLSPPFSSSVNETAQKATQTLTGPNVKTIAIVEETSTPVLVPPIPKDQAAQPLTVTAKEPAKPASSSNTLPTMIAGSSKQAAPASEPNPKPKVPSPFRGLADVLRNNGAMTKSALGSALLKSNPKAYSGYKNLKTLLSAAAQEGIVGLRLNKHREEVWSLEERYA